MSATNGHPPQENRRNNSGRSWAWGIAGTYTLFALSTLTFVGFTLTQRTDLVSDDYYQQGTAHHSHMEAASRAQALPEAQRWQATLNGDRLECLFPRTDIQGTLHLYRPADERLDRELAIDLAQGPQHIDGLQTGRWQLKILWQMDGQDYYHQQELLVGL